MNKGDRINWKHTSRGGYGYTTVVAGIFVKEGPKRVQIEVRERGLYEKHWTPRLKWVDKASITPRTLPCEALNEPMELVEQGFTVSYWKHPNGVCQALRNGTFYGTIDGYQVTAPCSSPEDAVRNAHHALLNGGYEVSLITNIECYQGWLKQGVKDEYLARAEKEIPELNERLKKVLDAGLGKRRH